MGHGTFDHGTWDMSSKRKARDRTSQSPEGTGTSHPTCVKSGAMNWTHLAALELIARHEAGESISAMSLEAARAALAQLARAHL